MIEQLRRLPKAERDKRIATLTTEEALSVLFDWPAWARPPQLPPTGDWRFWLLQAGRGFGKTRSGAEWSRKQAETPKSRGALVARTAADIRDVMVEGESGILAVSPPWFRPLYEPSKRRLTWPNGSIATLYSADKPDLLRGPQHHWAWCDELAAWRYPDAWDQLLFGLRLGLHPRAVVTTTPRPTKLLRELVKDPRTVVSRGTTRDNLGNLSASVIEDLERRYKGTRLGRQELQGILLKEVEGALWTLDLIDKDRTDQDPADLTRLVVGVDPPGSTAECGIVLAGTDRHGFGYVLEDASVAGSPKVWAEAVVSTFHSWGADRVVAEKNMGGDMVAHTLRTVDPDLPITMVWASRGKWTRAEPIAALYEQGRVRHVGVFAELEDQMTDWVPGDAVSPDRMDAAVWALTDLMLKRRMSAAAPGTPARVNPYSGV